MSVPSNHFHFLSLCLLYPEADLMPQLTEAAEAIEAEWPAEMLVDFQAVSLEDLQIEHTRLFVNSLPKVPCPPYESAYVDGSLLTATTAAVAQFYAEWGLTQSLETADFLPVELQFMAYLQELAAQSETPTLLEQAQRRFKREHLKPWLPQFAADLTQNAQLPFYQKLGEQLGGLMVNGE